MPQCCGVYGLLVQGESSLVNNKQPCVINFPVSPQCLTLACQSQVLSISLFWPALLAPGPLSGAPGRSSRATRPWELPSHHNHITTTAPFFPLSFQSITLARQACSLDCAAGALTPACLSAGKSPDATQLFWNQALLSGSRRHTRSFHQLHRRLSTSHLELCFNPHAPTPPHLSPSLSLSPCYLSHMLF